MSDLLLTSSLDGADPILVGPGTEAVATVSSTELADDHEGAVSDDELPIAIVLVILVLIVAGVAAGIFGFRSTRHKRDDIEHHGSQEPDPR